MKQTIILCSFILVLFTTISAQNSAGQNGSEWIGTYTYAIVLDRNPNSGYQDTVEYELKVFRRAGQTLVRYKADGLRTWDDYECRAEIAGDQLSIFYQKDLRTGELGSSDRNLRTGQFLGSLIKSVVRGKTRYTLKNGSLIDLARNPVFRKRA